MGDDKGQKRNLVSRGADEQLAAPDVDPSGKARPGPVFLSPDAAVRSSEDRPEAASLSLVHRLVRRGLHLWFRLSRGMTLGVRAVVIDPGGRVFLVRHTYMPGWHLPGGGIEVGQSARAALEMELAEEGNIALTGEPVFVGLYHNHIAAPRDHVALYVVRDFTQRGLRPPDREIAECGFFAPGALPEGTTAGTRRRLAEVLDGLTPVSTW
jgi:8-oxo-dGTP pyrophosphatase MutT (NUDIX family)